MRIFSWNVNGLRAVLNKGAFQDFLEHKDPDIVCLQETKAKKDQVTIDLPDYVEIWNSAERAGYSGTAIFVKNNIEHKIYSTDFALDYEDQFGKPSTEGRVLVVEFKEFYLVDVYTPNSKRSLERLDLRHKHWDPAFLTYLKELEKTKPVITCGDFNAAHEEIDIARPDSNHHNAGFTDEERQGITNIIDAGFIDTFRLQHPDEAHYTWWSHIGHCREKNIGWRIDYFFISEKLKNNLKSSNIYENIMGSDHCPISIEMEF